MSVQDGGEYYWICPKITDLLLSRDLIFSLKGLLCTLNVSMIFKIFDGPFFDSVSNRRLSKTIANGAPGLGRETRTCEVILYAYLLCS